jgi:hypothetical protein
MAYGTIKVDTITFTDAGVDKSVTISGLVQNPTFSGNITVTGTVSGNTIQGQTVSGATITGGAAAFTTVTGGVATITSGVFALGSASNPSISFVSDPNSGLYSPGADQVAISTNGTGRLFVNSDGTISIGSTGVLASPTVYSSASPTLSFSDGTNSAYAGLIGVQNRLLNLTGTGTTLIQSNRDIETNVVGSFPWIVKTANTERMRLDSSGRLGLGTSSVGYAIHLKQPNNNFSGGLAIESSVSSQKINCIIDGNNKFTIGFNETQVIALDNAGKVGIGTTSPSTNLHILNSSGAEVRVACSAFNPNSELNFWEGAAVTGNADTARLGVGKNNTALIFTNNLGTPRTAFAIGTSGAEPLVLSTNNTERARIDSSGRLLVGTSTSRAVGSTSSGLFQAELANTTGILASYIRNSADNVGSILALAKSRSTAIGSTTIVQNNDVLGQIRFAGADGVDLESNAASITAEVDGTPGANDMPGRLVFSTTADGASSPTARMDIKNNGFIRCFSDAAQVINLASSKASGTTDYILVGTSAATGFETGTNRILIFTNGNVQNTNGSYTTISDSKLKENIVSANSQWDDLKAIQIRNWNFKEETGYETHRQIGPIAQELEQVCPGLVFEAPDRDSDGNDLGTVTKGVNQSVLYMKAVKALQEAMERIETLEAKVAALEGA